MVHKVCIVGSGNWGSTVTKIIAENIKNEPLKDSFDPTIRMYVYNEIVNGRSLVDIINETHENIKYLPGIKLPDNILAISDLSEAAEGCDYFVFVTPHQYLPGLLEKIKGKAAPNSSGINLTKGVSIKDDKIELIPETVERVLGFPCGGLSGANIARNVAMEQFSEGTIAFSDRNIAERWFPLFNCKYFKCRIIDDVCFQQLLGTLKNVIALAAGFIDGLGYGENTKAAIIRIGLEEMYKFAKWYFPDKNIKEKTLLESCGTADLIATAYGGRIEKCAIEFVKTGKKWDEIERELLKGQKLQGTIAAREIYKILDIRKEANKFPLITKTYRIVEGLDPPSSILELYQ